MRFILETSFGCKVRVIVTENITPTWYTVAGKLIHIQSITAPFVLLLKRNYFTLKF